MTEAPSLFPDRLIHRPFDNELDGYQVRGAMSGILTVSLEPSSA